MSGIIIMPGNVEVARFDGKKYCLSDMTQSEIMTLIVQHAPEVPVGSELVIKHTSNGWDASLGVGL